MPTGADILNRRKDLEGTYQPSDAAECRAKCGRTQGIVGLQGSGRESLWSVSAKRLPYYLLGFALVMAVSVVASIATATEKFWDAVMTIASEIAAVGAATGGVC